MYRSGLLEFINTCRYGYIDMCVHQCFKNLSACVWMYGYVYRSGLLEYVNTGMDMRIGQGF